MKPLVSGAEAKRYQEPETDTYILFPYLHESGKARLIEPERMARDFPLAWDYLKRFERELRKREAKLDQTGEIAIIAKGEAESAPFDDGQWYRFGRHQGLDRQEFVKLIVAQTVPSLRVSGDFRGDRYLNNVRVNGIIGRDGNEAFLLGILNASVADWVFRRIAKPKDGGWFEANKQFIAPLPVPHADAETMAAVSTKARKLQDLHTAHRDALAALSRRLAAAPSKMHPLSFLFPDLRSVKDWQGTAPKKLAPAERQAWAKERHEEDLEARYGLVGQRLTPGAALDASLGDGELAFLVDGIAVVDRVFVSEAEGSFILAQWKAAASTFSITERTTGKQLCDALRKLLVTDNRALIDQIVDLQGRVQKLEAEIEVSEAAINALIYQAYGLTDEEIALVEAG